MPKLITRLALAVLSLTLTACEIPPAELTFETQPSTQILMCQKLPAQPVIQVTREDETQATEVTLAVYSDETCTVPATGMLRAKANPAPVVDGAAAFADVQYIGGEGTIYFGATAPGANPTCSTAVETAGSLQMKFAQQPSAETLVGAEFAKAPIVEIRDLCKNDLYDGPPIEIALKPFKDTSCKTAVKGTLLAATNPVPTAGGKSAFAQVSYDAPGTIYLRAKADGAPSVCSKAAAITTRLTASKALGPAATTKVPEGATLMSAEDFVKRVKSTQMRLSNSSNVYLTSEELLTPLATDTEADDKLLVDTYLKSRAAERALFRASPETDGSFIGKDGEEHPAVVQDLRAKYATLASSLRGYSERANLVTFYEVLHAKAPAEIRAAFPAKEELESLTDDEVERLVDQLAVSLADDSNEADEPVSAEPATAPGDCSGDSGSNPDTISDRDGYGGTCDAVSSAGVYAKYKFHLRPYASCTKNQASRGTCAAFGSVAAIETRLAVELGRRVNLSEQALYAQVKSYWYPSWFGDGAVVSDILSTLKSKQWTVPYEAAWDYNRSRGRKKNASTGAFTDSCKYYHETCSNTSHQAGLYCANVDSLLYCGYMSQLNPAGTGIRLGSHASVWKHGYPDTSIANLQAALKALHPVVFSAEVPKSFDNPDANGFVKYTSSAESSRGAHAYLIAGYISNSKLDSILPNAPAGSGGGYFIARNSWGLCYGDGGWVYLPYNWVKKYGLGASIVKDVTIRR